MNTKYHLCLCLSYLILNPGHVDFLMKTYRASVSHGPTQTPWAGILVVS